MSDKCLPIDKLISSLSQQGTYLIPIYLSPKRDKSGNVIKDVHGNIKYKKPPSPDVIGHSNWQKVPQKLDTLLAYGRHSKFEGLAVACGSRSGNLEAIDLDTKNDVQGVCKSYLESIKTAAPQLFEKLVIQRTVSGGFHIIYRCDTIGKNQKLHTNIIETKSEGGYIAIAPLKGYKLLQGSYENIPIISPEERKLLLDLAREKGNHTTRHETNPTLSQDMSCDSVGFESWKVKDTLNHFSVTWADGNRNFEIFKVAQELNRSGIEESTAISLLESNGIDFDQGNCEHLERLRKIYRDKSGEFGSTRDSKLKTFNSIYKKAGGKKTKKNPSKTPIQPIIKIDNEKDIDNLIRYHKNKMILDSRFRGYLPQEISSIAVERAKEGKNVLLIAPAGAGKTHSALIEVHKSNDGTVFVKLCPFRIQPEQISEDIVKNAMDDRIMAVTDRTHDDAKTNINNLQDSTLNAFVMSYDRNAAFVKAIAHAAERGIIKKLIVIIDESHLLTQAYDYRANAIDHVQALKKFAHGTISMTATPSRYCENQADEIIRVTRESQTKRTFQTFYTKSRKFFGNHIADKTFFIHTIKELAALETSVASEKNLIQVYCESINTIEMLKAELLNEGISKDEVAVIVGDKEKVTTHTKNYLSDQSKLHDNVKVLLHTSTCVQAINITNEYDHVYCICPVLNEADQNPRNFIQAANRARKAKHIHLLRIAPEDFKRRSDIDHREEYIDTRGMLRKKAEEQLQYYSRTQTEEQKRVKREMERKGIRYKSLRKVIDTVSSKPKLLLHYDPIGGELQVNELLIENLAERAEALKISEDSIARTLRQNEFVYDSMRLDIGKVDVEALEALTLEKKLKVREEHTKEVQEDYTATLNRVANIHSNQSTRNEAQRLLGENFEKCHDYIVDDQIESRYKCEQDTEALNLTKRGIGIESAYRIAKDLPLKDANYFSRLKSSIDYLQRQTLKSELDKMELDTATKNAIQTNVKGIQRVKLHEIEEQIANRIEEELINQVKPKLIEDVEKLQNLGYDVDKLRSHKFGGFPSICIHTLILQIPPKTCDHSQESKTGGGIGLKHRVNQSIKRALGRIERLLSSPIKLKRGVNIVDSTANSLLQTNVPLELERLGYSSSSEYLKSVVEKVFHTSFAVYEDRKLKADGTTSRIETTIHGRMTAEHLAAIYEIDYTHKACEQHIINQITDYLEKITAIHPESEEIAKAVEESKEVDRQNQLFYTLRDAFKLSTDISQLESKQEFKELLTLYPREAILSVICP